MQPTRTNRPNRRAGATRAAVAALALAAAAPLGGCALFRKPNKANIVVRKDNQKLQGQIDQLRREREGDRATIRALQQQQGGGLATLPPERLEKLFTTHGLHLGRLTGGADLDPAAPGHEGLKVYAGLVDESGQKFKAAGSFTVEAFDLGAAQGQDPRLGRWAFDTAQSRETWNGSLIQYGYILTCPWQTPPARPDVTLKVTFVDELTGREFVQQKVIRITPPSASNPGPATAPAARGAGPAGAAQ